MEAPILFYEPGSPPCRVVLMFLLENGIPHKIQRIKLFEKDHLQVLFFFSTLFPSSQPCHVRKPEYQKVNPFQKVPAIQDEDGFYLAESHAILKYLVRTRASMVQEHWYPSDPRKRAKIDGKYGLVGKRERECVCVYWILWAILELLDWHHSSLSWCTKVTVWNAVMVAK